MCLAGLSALLAVAASLFYMVAWKITLVDCSEGVLQRELVVLVFDHVVNPLYLLFAL